MARGDKVQVFASSGDLLGVGVFLRVWEFYRSRGEPVGLIELDDGRHAIAPMSWIKPVA